jgi:hypothetical protein
MPAQAPWDVRFKAKLAREAKPHQLAFSGVLHHY